MGIDDYKKLVASFGGRCYGNTHQGDFIARYNAVNMSARFLENISNFLLKNDRQSRHLIEEAGICNGLAQSLYLALSQSKDKEETLAQFAKKIDELDPQLARQANSLQEISDNYENINQSTFLKTLGLDLLQKVTFNPYEANDKVAFMMNKIDQFFFDHEQTVPSNEARPIDISHEKVFSDMLNFISSLPKEEFIRITLSFSKDSNKILQDFLGGHAITIYRFIKDGQDRFIFYDPNGLPTIFEDASSLQNFTKKYLDQIACEFKEMFEIQHGDNISFDVWEYAVDYDFHHRMNLLIPAIKNKIDSINRAVVSNDQLLTELNSLLKGCILAADNNQYYRKPFKLTNQLRDLFTEKVASALFDEAKPFYSTYELLQIIENDIQRLSVFDEGIAQELLKIINPDPSEPSVKFS